MAYTAKQYGTAKFPTDGCYIDPSPWAERPVVQPHTKAHGPNTTTTTKAHGPETATKAWPPTKDVMQ